MSSSPKPSNMDTETKPEDTSVGSKEEDTADTADTDTMKKVAASAKTKRNADGNGETQLRLSPRASKDDDKISFELTDNDVICTRNSSAHAHPGNQQYHAVVVEKAVIYKNLPKRADRIQMVRDIISHVETILKGRFLKYNADKGKWLELSTSEKREKIAHALRIAPAPNAVRKRQSALAKSIIQIPSRNGSKKGAGVDQSNPTRFATPKTKEGSPANESRKRTKKHSRRKESNEEDSDNDSKSKSFDPNGRAPKKMALKEGGDEEQGNHSKLASQIDATQQQLLLPQQQLVVPAIGQQLVVPAIGQPDLKLQAIVQQQNGINLQQQKMLVLQQIQQVQIQRGQVQQRLLLHQQAHQQAVQLQHTLLRQNIVSAVPSDHALLIRHEENQLILLQQKEVELRRAGFQIDQQLAMNIQNAQLQMVSVKEPKQKEREVDPESARSNSQEEDDSESAASRNKKPKASLESEAEQALMMLSGTSRSKQKTAAEEKQENSSDDDSAESAKQPSKPSRSGDSPKSPPKSALVPEASRAPAGSATILAHPLLPGYGSTVGQLSLVAPLANPLGAVVSNLQTTIDMNPSQENTQLTAINGYQSAAQNPAIVCLGASGANAMVNVECYSPELLRFLSENKIVIPVVSNNP